MKRVKNKIATEENFNKFCMAEYFNMMKSGRCEFVRGNVCLEVRVRKGIEMYTVWRLDKSGEYYEVEFPCTKDKAAVATHLYEINKYRSYGWDVPYESAVEARGLMYIA